MKAVAYTRVSSVSQVPGQPIVDQERIFHEFCISKGWEAGRVYREQGESVYVDDIANRPIFKQLLEDAAKNQFDVVVFHSLDRCSRTGQISLESISILEKYQVRLVVITKQSD